MTVVGTLTHEGGHYLAARLMGYEARINYMATFKMDDQPMNATQSFWMILGGPLETIVTGSIGFFFLCRLTYPIQKLSIAQWALIFLSLLCLREPCNFAVWLGTYLITGNYSAQGDEIRLSRYLHWSDWSLISATALIGALILAYVVFRIVPKPQRVTFLASGLVGGVLGYLLWLVYFGKMIMP